MTSAGVCLRLSSTWPSPVTSPTEGHPRDFKNGAQLSALHNVRVGLTGIHACRAGWIHPFNGHVPSRPLGGCPLFQSAAVRILVTVLMASTLFGEPESGASSKTVARALVVSFPTVRLARGERIVGFELTVTAASINTVAQVPADWSLKLDVASGSQVVLSGTCGHGASALQSAQELPRVTVVPDGSSVTTSPQFSAEAVLHLTGDFQSTRTLTLSFSELSIQKRGP